MAAISSLVSTCSFVEVLSVVSDWYGLGLLLGVSISEQNEIAATYTTLGKERCLTELYQCLEKKEGVGSLSWETIVGALRIMKHDSLASEVIMKYIRPLYPTRTLQHSPRNDSHLVSNEQREPPTQTSPTTPGSSGVKEEYDLLLDRFTLISSKIKTILTTAEVNLVEIQQEFINKNGAFVKDFVKLTQQHKATADNVLDVVRNHCSAINPHVLLLLAKRYITDQSLMNDVRQFEVFLNNFKSFVKVADLFSLHHNTNRTDTGMDKVVKLKVQRFWNDLTIQKFEVLVNEIFQSVYNILSNVVMENDNECVSFIWTAPIDINPLIPRLSTELLLTIGVIGLDIGDTVVYNIEGDGCETVKGAMLHGIESKEARGIELLLSIGCSPEIACNNGDNTVINIVNIRDKDDDDDSMSIDDTSSVQYVCVFGHNEHIEAILNDHDDECSTCDANDKMIKGLKQINEELHLKLNEQRSTAEKEKQELDRIRDQLEKENEELRILIEKKDAEIAELTENLMEEDSGADPLTSSV